MGTTQVIEPSLYNPTPFQVALTKNIENWMVVKLIKKRMYKYWNNIKHIKYLQQRQLIHLVGTCFTFTMLNYIENG